MQSAVSRNRRVQGNKPTHDTLAVVVEGAPGQELYYHSSGLLLGDIVDIASSVTRE